MIVEQLTVKHWRGFREEHAFTFEPGLNLLVGLNEAGKSTLFEVLQRTFFDRHSGTAQEIKAMQPLASSLGPEAEIVVRTGQGRYLVRKRFLDSPFSELHSERGESWELDHDGDEADTQIRKLLEGDVPGRGATKQEHRGLAQALWYLQREPPVPGQRWNEAVERGLQGLVEVVASTPAEDTLLEAIGQAYKEHWTRTGRLAAKSPLKELQDEIPGLEAELTALREQLGAAHEHRQALEKLEVENEEKTQLLSEEQTREKGLQRDLQQGQDLEEKTRAAKDRLKELKKEMDSTSKDLERVSELDQEISDESEQLEEANIRLAETERDEHQAKADSREVQAELNNDIKPRLKELEKELTQVRARSDLVRLKEEQGRLQVLVEDVEKARSNVKRLRNEIAELDAPSEEDLEELKDKDRTLDLAQAQAEVAAIRVRFDLDEDRKIETEPSAEREGEEYLITGATVFRLHDVGSISIRGGGEDLEKLREEIQGLEGDIESFLRRYDAADVRDVVELRQKQVDLEQALAAAEEKLFDLEEEDPEAELQKIRNQMEAAERSSDGFSEELLSLEEGELLARLSDLEDEREDIAKREEELSSTQATAQDRHLAAVEEKAKAEAAVTSLETALKSLRNRKAEILDQYGTLDRLEKTVDQAGEEIKTQEKALAELEAEYEKKVEEPRRELERVQKTVGRLETALQDLETKITRRTAQIETLTGQALYSRIGDLEAQLEVKSRRLPVLKERAEAAKLLKTLVDEFQKERSGALAGPVAERVGTWLSQITGDSYSALDLGPGLMPRSVRFDRYDTSLDATELSYGTHEQVVVLLRLGIGALLSEAEPRLVVLDDRLVNADPVRRRRFQPILEEVADSCQVLLATCSDSAYTGMEAAVVRVPEDGRIDQ